ncbi:MAG: SAM-dependent methyltransferase, partial [Cellvibrio sp.]|nr:SAM-dependent methyltransferase [Cellvibrio sp.]
MPNSVAVLCNYPPLLSQAEAFSAFLQLPLLVNQAAATIDTFGFVVLFAQEAIQLQQTGRKAPGPIIAEFTEGAVDHRRKFGGGKGQMIAKAVGVKAGVYPRVL